MIPRPKGKSVPVSLPAAAPLATASFRDLWDIWNQQSQSRRNVKREVLLCKQQHNTSTLLNHGLIFPKKYGKSNHWANTKGFWLAYLFLSSLLLTEGMSRDKFNTPETWNPIAQIVMCCDGLSLKSTDYFNLATLLNYFLRKIAKEDGLGSANG